MRQRKLKAGGCGKKMARGRKERDGLRRRYVRWVNEGDDGGVTVYERNEISKDERSDSIPRR